MDISAVELRALAADVDTQHRDGMATMARDIRELHAETRATRRSTRRDILKRAGVGGGTIAIGTAIIPFARLAPAGAQEMDDAAIATFAESVELAAVEAYKAAAGSGKLAVAVVDIGTMFAAHHSEHAKAFAGAAGSSATGKPNAALLKAVGPQLQAAKDQTALLQIAYDLESSAAATYLFALGALQSEAALKLAASILPIESQHAVVLGQALGKPATEYVPAFETQDKALSPTEFPVA
jgi:hypothetical protein